MSKISPAVIMNELVDRFSSAREFARAIGEDPSDVMKWRLGKIKVRPRAVISICRLYPCINPADLNPSVFPADLRLSFGEKK